MWCRLNARHMGQIKCVSDCMMFSLVHVRLCKASGQSVYYACDVVQTGIIWAATDFDPKFDLWYMMSRMSLCEIKEAILYKISDLYFYLYLCNMLCYQLTVSDYSRQR